MSSFSGICHQFFVIDELRFVGFEPMHRNLLLWNTGEVFQPRFRCRRRVNFYVDYWMHSR